jgi:hypothetical protein
MDSFRKLMETDLPVYSAAGNVYGLLRWGIDVSDLLAAYKGELVVKDPVDGLMRPVAAGSEKLSNTDMAEPVGVPTPPE